MLAQDVFEMVNYAQRIYIISANFVIQALCSVLTRNIITNPPNFSFPALISDEEWIKNLGAERHACHSLPKISSRLDERQLGLRQSPAFELLTLPRSLS
jgi:hypothetical protein